MFIIKQFKRLKISSQPYGRLPERIEELENVSEELDEILRTNMEKASTRRQVRERFKHVQYQIDHCLMKVPCEGLRIKEYYEVNSRGLKIFTKSWIPENRSLKALVYYCYGYGDTCTFTFEGIARKLASAGYGVIGMDYPGFGLSDGLHGFIPSMDQLVDAVVENFSKIKENPEFHDLPSYLFGQSMGGLVALLVHLKQPDSWSGAVLNAPMCNTSPMSYYVAPILNILNHFFAKLKVFPITETFIVSREMKKRQLNAAYNVVRYRDRTHLGTIVELVRSTKELLRRLDEVTLPLLILQGGADSVIDPTKTVAACKKVGSKDKELKIYKDAYHNLLEGEPDDMIFQVIGDIVSWLDDHTKIE